MTKHTFKSQFTTEFEFSQAKTAEINNNNPKYTVVYIHGLCSDPWGAKPEAIKQISLELGLDFIRFELAGHGSAKADYIKTDFNVWKAQTLEVIDELVKGDVIMFGSSIGGWLSLIAGIERPERVKGILTLAAAPDLQDEFYQVFTDGQITALNSGEVISVGNKDFSYTFTKKIIDSLEENALLKSPIKINCPVKLLHGMQDVFIPWKKAVKIAELIENKKAEIKLLKNSNHCLGSPSDLDTARKSLAAVLKLNH